MKKIGCMTSGWAIGVFLLLLAASFPFTLHAQQCPSTFYDPGDKYVWQSSSSRVVAHDYIDLSQLAAGSTDVCSAISAGLTQLGASVTQNCPVYNGNGVLDARGITPTGSGTFSCQTSPFQQPTGTSQPTQYYVTILLPAGTINVSAPWVLPPNTRLIGQGSHNPTGNTLFQASSFSGAILYMGDQQPYTGSGSLCRTNCNGISIEHLALDGGSTSGLDGIDNYYAQELNYVNDVALTNIAGTGLRIVGGAPYGVNYGANNSGPYTNIYFSGSGTCLNINGTNNTRGVNGLDCHGTGTPSGPAILLDAHNNTIQNVSISGGYAGKDGVLIGSQGSYAQNNLLMNIGSTSVKNVVHISNTMGVPTDLTLMGISGGTTSTIQDDVTSSNVPTDSKGLALYVLGEPIMSGANVLGYSRFTTSNSNGSSGSSGTPAWFQGPLAPGTACGTSTTVANGSLYSITSTISSGTTLWGCIVGTWTKLSGNN